MQGLQVGGQLVRRESAVLGDVPGQEDRDAGAREGEAVEGRHADLGRQRQRQVPGEERIQVPPAVEQVEARLAAEPDTKILADEWFRREAEEVVATTGRDDLVEPYELVVGSRMNVEGLARYLRKKR